MKKYIFSIFLIIFLLTNISYSQTSPACTFYPLKIGDLWQYRVIFVLNNTNVDTTYYSYKEVLGDTLMPNGFTYKIVSEESLDAYEPGAINIRYIMVDSVSANVYEYFEGTENIKGRLIDSLECQDQDTFFDGEGIFYHCEELGIVSVLGYETECKYISSDSPDQYESHNLANDIGVYCQWKGFHEGYGGDKDFDLVYAKINGIEFGEQPLSIYKDKMLLSGFKLLQNYPNPFNPSTTIQYNLKISGKVELSIYDATGNLISTLINGYQQAGQHSIKFDGNRLATGLYVVDLNFNNQRMTKKMVLIK